MIRFGAIIRAVMLVASLVPFTSVQQASGALAPFLPDAPVPEGQAPGTPFGEEDDERETETADGKERDTTASRHRLPVREQVGTLPPMHVSHRSHITRVRVTPPVAADPFRNGLGTPYRC